MRFLLLLFCLLCFVLVSAETLDIKRDKTPLREGAGSWYEVIELIQKGERVETVAYSDDNQITNQWLKVKYNSKVGFISVISTKELKPKKDIFSNFAEGKPSTIATKHGVSAGVKGFGERFCSTFKVSPKFIEYAQSYNINPRDYKKFKLDTYKGFWIRKNRKKVDLGDKFHEEYFTESERGLGLGIASVISQQGLVKNKKLQDYVNFVGLQLVEAFDLSEIEFKFFILDIDNPNAYATTGGVVFITKGMLNLCQNEAELSLILAHEIAHVAYNHGMQETLARKTDILADSSFDELDKEFGNSTSRYKDLEAELEEDAFKIYETLIHGRLDAYELEADQMAILVTARAGYNANLMPKVLDRLINNSVKSNNEHYRPDILVTRKKQVEKFLKSRPLPSNLMIHQERFDKFIQLLD